MKYELQYNGKSSGKKFKTKQAAKKEWKRLWDLNLFGYTINSLSPPSKH